ncbi:hypothetical protein BXZ70DRAFT_316721 [Cristinia sonorae]|uniref:C2H2-type domain-containing protein n=1 Tax=Cristinia sonorae TaxID=1940300 RepID=A0A8K0ULJ6_9AGAR|nr:hypothetical protein BXZ70DRAFT_316721 [Cristinia sonorae]
MDPETQRLVKPYLIEDTARKKGLKAIMRGLKSPEQIIVETQEMQDGTKKKGTATRWRCRNKHCAATRTRLQDLNRHHESCKHSPKIVLMLSKQWVCGYPGCHYRDRSGPGRQGSMGDDELVEPYRTRQKSNLVDHVARHLGIKFPCAHCSLVFDDRPAVSKHLQGLIPRRIRRKRDGQYTEIARKLEPAIETAKRKDRMAKTNATRDSECEVMQVNASSDECESSWAAQEVAVAKHLTLRKFSGATSGDRSTQENYL